MTSEAGGRSLAARLAPSKTHDRQSDMPSGAVARPRKSRSTAAWKLDAKGVKASNGSGKHAVDSHGASGSHGTNDRGHGQRRLEPVRAALPTPTSLVHDDPLDVLLNEAQSAVSDGANTLRDVRERYRTAYLEPVDRWERLRTQTSTGGGAGASSSTQAASQETMIGREVNQERSTLGRIDLAVKSLENAWLFLAREDTSLVSDPSGPPSAADAQMRIVEAQEAERSRLAREVHDGPAQALSNAIFQVEVVQRLLDRDEAAARAELQQLRDVLTRELKGVRAYLSQLRPPLLADLGLSGAIQE